MEARSELFLKMCSARAGEYVGRMERQKKGKRVLGAIEPIDERHIALLT